MIYRQPPDHFSRLDGTHQQLWEPLWNLSIQLNPIEVKLLQMAAVRRLHFIHHGGCSYITTPHMHSRLQHTLGVFAVIAHFHPDNEELRAAALLHDIGHAPFSHTLEGIRSIDHHLWTQELIRSEPIATLFMDYGLDMDNVLQYITAERPSILRNHSQALHVDHLDSWVRSAQIWGTLSMSAAQILTRININNDVIDTDVETASLLVELIINEAKFHCSAANIGPNVIMEQLAKRWINEAEIETYTLRDMTDAQVEAAIIQHPSTREEAQRLWFNTSDIQVTRSIHKAPKHAYKTHIRKLYLSMPLTEGKPFTQVIPEMNATIDDATQMLGTYYVYWKS